MLKQLTISNYALIDFIDIKFNEGFSIITGETGAGKSIMLGALLLILGERADSKTVRDKDKKSVIEAVFNLKGYDLQSFFEENEIEYDEESILRREILSNGRSRAFINDTPVSIGVLHELSVRLIDIHSQHNNMLLADANYQLSIIDSIAQNQEIQAKYNLLFQEYQNTKSEYNALKKRLEKNKSDEEYFRFQLSQLSALNLQIGEEEELENAQLRLSNVSEIKASLWEVTQNLNGDESSALLLIKNAISKFNSLGEILPESNELSNRLESVLIELKDIESTSNIILESINYDPIELERIGNRLNDIFNLKRKHNVESVEDLIAIQNKLEKILSELENSELDLTSLERSVSTCLRNLEKEGLKLSESRKEAADKFSKELQETAIPLGMKNLQCNVSFEKIEPSKNGLDKIQFLFSFNKNQELLPIGNNASGGEISRLMLCIKLIIARSMQLPTLIFDEIDTGVSGDIANKMAEMMQSIASKRQVITITHLPQVAAMGDSHYKVYKKDTNDATISDIIELNYEDRVTEIAGMLSGAQINQAAIDNAISLLNHK